jgi:sugar O-acyltransferase (sialic acid O-acetyltransferase NeuD family)
MNNIAIYGAGGFGREVKMLIDQINQHEYKYKFIGYFDDGRSIGELINGFPVLGGINELNSYQGELYLVFSIGDPRIKRKLIDRITKNELSYPVLIHPSCIIGNDNVEIGEGSIICAGNIITVDITIGRHVVLNLACTVGHDTIIGDFCSLMPSVNISGEVQIEAGVYFGTGCKIINQIKIGQFSIIGAAALVAKNIPSYCTAVGIPAKPIKFHNEN